MSTAASQAPARGYTSRPVRVLPVTEERLSFGGETRNQSFSYSRTCNACYRGPHIWVVDDGTTRVYLKEECGIILQIPELTDEEPVMVLCGDVVSDQSGLTSA